MAGRLITVEEAAKLLGMSPNDVSEMRQRQEIFGFRDGTNWKYKEDDVLRIVQDRSGGGTSSFSALDMPGSGDDLVLGGSSLSGGSNLDLSGSGLMLGDSMLGGGNKPKTNEPAGSTGGFPVMGGSVLGGPGSGLDLLGSDVQLAALSGTGSSILNEPSSSLIGGDAGKTILTAELANKPPVDSSIKLSVRENDSVLSDPGSDVSLDVAGSGINLLAPKDSGILLDNLDLSASGIGKRTGSDIKKDEDFLLTPTEDRGEDSTDSGSQVIALDEQIGEDATATLLAGDIPGMGGALEDAGLGGGYGSPMGGGGMMSMQPAVPDTVFGMGSVATLAVSAIFMAVTGVMMYDIMRNMWSWETPLSFNSSLMDMILSRGK